MGGSRRNSNFQRGRKAPESTEASTSLREKGIFHSLKRYVILTRWPSIGEISTREHRIHASWSGQTEAVQFLCNLKADVGAAAIDDMGAIHFASQKGHLEIVRILLSAGASISACTRKGFTPLHYAVQGSHLELMKYLLRKGASLRAMTKAGKVPLDLTSNDEIRTLLVDHGKSSKRTEDAVVKEKAEDTAPEQSPAHASRNDGDVEERTEGRDVDSEERTNATKNRSTMKTNNYDSAPQPKRTKVTLNHHLAADDNQEE